MVNLKQKIIAFDLDGTLAESKQEMKTEMSSLLKDLVKERMVVIISGGSISQFEKQFLPSLTNTDKDELFFDNLFLLPTSGSRRYQYNKANSSWVITDTVEMLPEVSKKVMLALEEYIALGKYDIHAVIPGDKIIEDRVTQITLSALGQHAPLSDKSIWDPNQLKRKQIKKDLEEILPEVEINIGGSTSIDILPKGFNKAKGLLRLLDRLGMSIEDMLFVGDAIFPGGNDYSPYEAGIQCIKTSGPTETQEIIKSWLR